MTKVARALAAGRLARALLRFSAEWRGHPDSWGNLHGLIMSPNNPWRIPSMLWRIPIIPIRIWMRVGDALLFRAWYACRPFLERVAAEADPEFVDRHLARYELVNQDLALRDRLGIAPDGGRFSADAEKEAS